MKSAVYNEVALVLLAPLTLGMFDVYLASSQRTQLQDALDAASLFAARSTATTSAQIDAIGDKALAANLVLSNGTTLVASNFALNGNTVTGYAEVTPSAIAPGLWPHNNIKVNSTVQRSVDRIEIALAVRDDLRVLGRLPRECGRHRRPRLPHLRDVGGDPAALRLRALVERVEADLGLRERIRRA